ncbi:MAG: HIT family protein [Nitrosopumilus sp.]
MDCIFCKIVAGEIPTKFLNETTHSVSLLDAFPLAKGHVLVIPKNHHQKIQEMSQEENTDLFSHVQLMTAKVDTITGATLIAIHNGKEAGQEIPHIHVHLVPRRKNDSAGTIHQLFTRPVNMSESETNNIYTKLKM